MKLTFREFQALLISHGFDLPRFGADGYWGDETAEAVRRWAGSAQELNLDKDSPFPMPPSGPTPTVPAPADWMPAARMKRIITHWTAGAHKANATDRKHYHILIEGDGKLVRGDHSIKDNQSTSDGYAAHTRGANTGSIGVSVCAMAGAVESPFKPGNSPVTPAQWDTLISVVAQLCVRYDIPVTRETVLSHCEVSKNLGISQAGKWDIAQLVFRPETWTELGDVFRDAVRKEVFNASP